MPFALPPTNGKTLAKFRPSLEIYYKQLYFIVFLNLVTSVTRFGEISPLGQHFMNVYQMVEGLFCVWQILEHTLAKLLCVWTVFQCFTWPNIGKTSDHTGGNTGMVTPFRPSSVLTYLWQNPKLFEKGIFYHLPCKLFKGVVVDYIPLYITSWLLWGWYKIVYSQQETLVNLLYLDVAKHTIRRISFLHQSNTTSCCGSVWLYQVVSNQCDQIWQNYKSILQLFEGSFSFCQKLEPTLANILCYFWANFHLLWKKAFLTASPVSLSKLILTLKTLGRFPETEASSWENTMPADVTRRRTNI